MGSRRFATGVVSALCGAACWGFSGTCMQFLFERSEAPVLFTAAWRMTIAGVLLTLWLLVFRRGKLSALLADRASVASIVVFGLIGLFFCQVSYMLAIDWTNAGTATVLQASNVIFVLALACITGRRLPHVTELAGVVTALAATVLIATKGDLSTLAIPPQGLFWGLASAVAVCFYVSWPVKLFDKWGSTPVTALGMLVGGVTAIVVLVVTELAGVSDALGTAGSAASAASTATTQAASDGYGTGAFSWLSTLDGASWAALWAIALVGTLASFGLYLHGVSIVGSVRGSLLGTVEPAAACIIAWAWLSTAFTWADWLGMLLMIATVFLVSIPRRPTS